MIKLSLAAALILTGASSPVFAQALSPRTPAPPRAPVFQPSQSLAGQDTGWGRIGARERAFARFRATLRDLREQALEWRAVDGGTLTAEHSAMIQAALDEAQADYSRYRRSPW